LELSPSEKKALASFLTYDPSRVTILLSFVPYLLPTVLLAGYGIYQKEYIACALAFVCLLVLSVWYLKISFDQGRLLKSVFEKYEKELEVLRSSGGTDI
jgi:hypothetical protein